MQRLRDGPEHVLLIAIPPSLTPSLPSRDCTETASEMKSTSGCVALDKSLALSELQLPSLYSGFIVLTFQDYARIQFIQSPNIH